jgi:hypothetical protein
MLFAVEDPMRSQWLQFILEICDRAAFQRRAMAGSRVGPVPFAFLLALAAEANAGQVPFAADGKNQLKSGMLSDLLKINGPPGFSEQVRDGKPTTVVQQFNNCQYGSWRRC